MINFLPKKNPAVARAVFGAMIARGTKVLVGYARYHKKVSSASRKINGRQSPPVLIYSLFTMTAFALRV